MPAHTAPARAIGARVSRRLDGQLGTVTAVEDLGEFLIVHVELDATDEQPEGYERHIAGTETSFRVLTAHEVAEPAPVAVLRERAILLARQILDSRKANRYAEAADLAGHLRDVHAELAAARAEHAASVEVEAEHVRMAATGVALSIPEQVARLAQLDVELRALGEGRGTPGLSARSAATLTAMYDRTLAEWSELDRLRTARGELAERQAVAALCARRSR